MVRSGAGSSMSRRSSFRVRCRAVGSGVVWLRWWRMLAMYSEL